MICHKRPLAKSAPFSQNPIKNHNFSKVANLFEKVNYCRHEFREPHKEFLFDVMCLDTRNCDEVYIPSGSSPRLILSAKEEQFEMTTILEPDF